MKDGEHVREVACHSVNRDWIAQALGGVEERAKRHWIHPHYNDLSLQGLQRMRDALLDHVAARSLEDPVLAAEPTLTLLLSAAESVFGILFLASFPDGVLEIRLSHFSYDSTSSDGRCIGSDDVDRTPTTDTWVDAFALSLVSSTLWDKEGSSVCNCLKITPTQSRPGRRTHLSR
ncbi:hypothetical protein [Nocardiopsis synnemataformans]|uniref:hypothetical protein n=1 Tax=Nocardiopsis synnemataformans TaxID=61305 RepID=UPI003EB97A0B